MNTIGEKSSITQSLTAQLSEQNTKVPFLRDEILIKALRFLEQHGLPNTKHEDYKYCNLEAVIRKEFKDLPQVFVLGDQSQSYKDNHYLNLILLNGKYAPELSDPTHDEGIIVQDFNENSGEINELIGTLAEADSDAFIALNSAYCRAGVYIKVPANRHLKKPIRISNLIASESTAFLNCRNLIHLERGASAHLIFENIYTGPHKVFCNQLSERILEPNAQLKATELQTRHEQLYAVNSIWTEAHTSSLYDCITISSSGQVIRNNHNVKLSGENASAHLYGLLTCREHQLIDNHTLMDHRVANCESNELYKGIAAGKSTAVFNGKIFVRKNAQKTNAYQSSKNILLSDEAGIYTKPQLEIYANDVKCSHGTSTGKIDEEALFYLKARGLGEENARKLLLQAFAGDVIERLSDPQLQEEIQQHFEKLI